MMEPIEKRIYKFITHSEVLEKVSVNYHKMAFATSLDKCREIKRAIKYHDFKMPARELAKMVLMYQKHLYNILPSSKNTSYKNSLTKLQQIITDARNMLEPIYPLIQNLNNNGVRSTEKLA
jgi:hypothetical protein